MHSQKPPFANLRVLRAFAVRFCFCLALGGCGKGASFEGLAPTQETGGPRVSFDLSHTPRPEIPFPNDLAARPDPASPTGLRINASLIAPTQLERNLRGLLDTLDGFGTFAPITVSFDRDLDVLDLYNRQNNADPRDDGVYLVDLATGATTPLDFNGGHFPYTLNDPGQYFLNDPNTGAFNLLFPVTGPAANFLHPELPHDTLRAQADDLLTFYERATRTLILRPVVPLAQEHKYAVVLTNKVRGTDGKSIVSPHAGINHRAQTAELQPLLSNLPGSGKLEDVAYTWAFTTQSTTRDLELIRRGLYGDGPLRTLSSAYRVRNVASSTQYATRMTVLQERGTWPPTDASPPKPGDFILPVNDCAAPPAPPGCLSALLADPQIRNLLIGGDALAGQALLDSFRYVDYFVSGTFVSPSFLNTDNGAPADQSFQIDEKNGTARTSPEKVTFILAVPKPRPEVGHLPPFPTVIAGHGYKSMRVEHILGFGGTFAKFGLATIAIDAYGHGIGIDPLLEVTARTLSKKYGLDAFAAAVFQGRARDLDYDGIKDSGGDFWTAEPFHTRDVVRQSVVDWMQLVRLLRTFDGTGQQLLGTLVNRAGDFNNDGVPDIAGPVTWPFNVLAADNKTHLFEKGALNPGSDLFAFGISLGGILTGILPAVEPAIVAAGPTSGAGGLADVGIRSTLDQVVQAVFLELFGPIVATCPFSPLGGGIDPQTGIHYGACNATASDAQPMLVLVVQDVNRERDLPIARLSLAPGQQVMVKNLAQTTADCSHGEKIDGCSVGTADAQGRLRLPVAADWPSLLATRTDRGAGVVEQVKVQVLSPGDPLQVTVLGAQPRVIDTWEVEARFFGVDYQAGAPLTSPARGYGLTRNTPDFRRLMGLSQLILEPGDPVNYAPHYFNDLLPARDNVERETGVRAGPANVLVIATSGDPGVPINTAISLARAAGLVELRKPDPAYGIPIDQVLIRAGVVEAVPATARFADPDGGVFAALPGHVRCDPGANCSGSVLIDPTSYACDAGVCLDGLQAPRLDPPLQQQLVTISAPRAAACSLSPHATGTGCWSTGASSCAQGPGISALLIPYLNRTGQHGFRNPQPDKPFDLDQFMANVVGRYFECRGRELHFELCQQDLASCPWIPPPP